MKIARNNILNTQSVLNWRRSAPYLAKLTVTLSLLGCAVQAHAIPTYTITDIGINPTAINPNGLIIGSNYFLYDSANTNLTNIQLLTDGAAFTTVNDINMSGQVAGIAANFAYARDSNGAGINIGVLPGDATSAAYASNDMGQVVGISAPSSATPCVVHGFLGNLSAASGQLQDLGSLGGGRNYAFDINANGQVVGKSSYNLATDCTVAGNYHAYISTSIGLRDLHGTAMLGKNSVAYKVNNKGKVVGDFANGLVTTGSSAYYPNGYPINHAVVWDSVANTYVDLGNGNKDSSLRAINTNGDMVGFERTFSNANFSGTLPLVTAQNAVIAYSNSVGLIDLNTLVTNMPTGWSLRTAVDINDAGQIVGSARDTSGLTHGILLTPSVAAVLPSAPTGLTAVAASTTQINLSWTDNATNETEQYLERCQGVGCTNFAVIATLAAGVTSYSDQRLNSATTYSYRVKAHALSGDSNYSTVLAIATLTPVVDPASQLPLAPTKLTGVATSRSIITLNWTDNANNEQNYLIEACKGQTCTDFKLIATKSTNTVTFTNSSLNRNTYYRYRVRAANTTGKSAYSNITTVKTLS